MLDSVTAFFAAIRNGNRAEVKELLARDSQLVHARDDEGATALHFAALAGDRELADLLIEHGATLNQRDGRWGATPAGWAIEYLRERGGLLGIEIDDVEFAIQRKDSIWVKRLLDRFPQLKNTTTAGGTPLKDLAEKSGNYEIISLFETSLPDDV